VKDLDELDVTVEPKTKVERVYREQGARLWRAVFLVSGDREVASDAVSEAFAQALARGTDLKSIENWVWRTAFRVAMGLLQDKSKMTQLVEEPTYEMSGAADDVVRALRSLSPSQRAVIVLHYYADCPIREIATRIGSTPAAVGVHLHRARKRLRSLLEADNG
jgi:RNA polymerase sigma-70 factor (ECF subfamily)